jgi:hypothetical protein
MRAFMIVAWVALALGSVSGPTQAENIVCLGEAISSRAISHGHDGQVDSAIGTNGDNCLFAAESSVGRKIEKVCPIRDMNSSDESGPSCRVEAIVRKGIIKRIISITKLNKQ